GPRVKEYRPDAIRYEPNSIGSQFVTQLKKKQTLAVCHNALIGRHEGPAIGRHVIDVLPHAIPQSEKIRATFGSLSAHRVIPALFKAVHGHHVWRACL